MSILDIPNVPAKTTKKNAAKTPVKVGRIVGIVEKFQEPFVTDKGEATAPLPNYKGLTAENLARLMIIEEETGLYTSFLKAHVTPERMEQIKVDLFAGITKPQLKKLGEVVGEILAGYKAQEAALAEKAEKSA